MPTIRHDSVKFVIVAHMDDWQLFMNPLIFAEQSSERNKVVFIYTTGNDAGRDELYWRGNEEAAISSTRFGLPRANDWNEMRDTVHINNHLIHRWSALNAVCYFLRLPDGNLDGSGFETQQFQSLQKLYQGRIPSIQALDHSAVYTGWHDVVRTLAAIVHHESAAIASVEIHHSEPDSTINPADHSDHRMTGLSAQSLPQYPRSIGYSYIGYDLDNYPPDLSGERLFWKAGQFAVYDQTLFERTQYSILKDIPATFIGYCLRMPRYRLFYKR